MRKVFKYFFLILITLLISSDFKIVSSETVYEVDSSGNYYFDYASDDTTSYYSTLDGLTGDTFKEELHTIISSGNISKFEYDDVTDKLKTLDEDPNNSNNILCILTGKSLLKSNFGGNGTIFWNREHIWPKAHGFNDDSLAPYTDLHHLRAAEQYTNSTYHNERDYGEIEVGGKSDEFGNKYINSTESSTGYGLYEPRDAVKGDIARIIMYMDVRYEGDSLSDNIELIISETNTSVSSTPGYIGLLNVLLKWHIVDPVDDLERRRNDMTYDIQGNRNPFIDHPEYANIIYNTEYDSLEDDEYQVIYYVSNGTFDYVDNTQYKLNDLVTKPNVDPISSRYDYVFSGWAKADGSLFDFSTDTIAGNLKLYAVWEYSPLPVKDMFEMSTTLSALHLKYSLEQIEEEPILQQSTMTVVADMGSKTLKKNQVYDYDEFIDYNKTDLKITYETNDKGNVFIKDGIFRLYAGAGNGTALKFEAREGSNAKITDISFEGTTVSPSSGNTLDNMVSKTIASDGSYAYLQNITNETNGNQINITKVIITYYVETTDVKPIFEELGLIFGLELPKEAYLELISSGNEVSFGIMIGSAYYDVEVVELTDSYKIYKELSLTNFNTIYTGKIFVKIDGATYYTNSASHSAKTLSQLYISSYINNSIVYDNRVALKYIINN